MKTLALNVKVQYSRDDSGMLHYPSHDDLPQYRPANTPIPKKAQEAVPHEDLIANAFLG